MQNEVNKSAKDLTYEDGKKIIPEQQLKALGEHEHDESIRYKIRALPKDENHFNAGIEVLVMEPGTRKVEEAQTQEEIDSTEKESLSTAEITGTYDVRTKISANMKGRDDDEDRQEIDSADATVTYTITVIDGNRIHVK